MTGVILLQLGTPDEPTPEALRRYLREFLSDRRVIDLNRALWLPILYLRVLRTRPQESAALYRKVWTPQGSPLLVTTNAQATALEQRISAAAGRRVPVVVGMRYGHPSIAEAVELLTRQGVDRLLAFPMYPQYAGATTGSSLERLFDVVERMRVVPAVRVVPPYFDDPDYINALAAVARETLASRQSQPTRVLLSFHGLPKRYADEGDPYPKQCEVTAGLLRRVLDLPAETLQLVFQSRFGREVWLQPYTDVTLEQLGRSGDRVAVMCPGFTADCLETLEEIRLRGAEQFHSSGGQDFVAIPCLNDHPSWLEAMENIARRELSGWI
jgi:protoporphyrin/coproporphyrin ferrochelatase